MTDLIATPEPESTPPATTDAAAEPTPVGTAGASEAPPNELPLFEAPARYTGRFAAVYTTLGVALAAALTGLIVLVIQPGHTNGPGWSNWKPKAGTPQSVAQSIATYVAPRYRLGENQGQLVADITDKPQVTVGNQKIAIRVVAVRKAPQSNTGILEFATDNMVVDTLCGLGQHCSIDTGTPSVERGRLVRREALEMALYTFKYAPGVDSITAFLTPSPGQTTGDVLYLRKDDFKTQLSQPLSKTLPLDTPPLPSASDTSEASTIDKLTEPHLYTYSLVALQTGGAALLLDPAA